MYKRLDKRALQELIDIGLWHDIINNNENFGSLFIPDDFSRYLTSRKRVVDDDFRWVFDDSDIRVEDIDSIERTIDRDLRVLIDALEEDGFIISLGHL